MKIKLWLSAWDCGDGSNTVELNNTKKEALKSLNLESEDEIDNYYDDGIIEEVELEIDENGKLLKTFHINIE
jgi:hypothetical protein